MYTKRAKQATNKDNAAACLCFLNYLATLQPAADRAVCILPWVVSRGRSYGLFWAGSRTKKKVRKNDPTPAYSPVSVQNRLTALFGVHWARSVQAPMSRISGPNSTHRRTTLSKHVKKRGAPFPHRKPLRGERDWEDGTLNAFIGSLDR
jgi:hypothetical protein